MISDKFSLPNAELIKAMAVFTLIKLNQFYKIDEICQFNPQFSILMFVCLKSWNSIIVLPQFLQLFAKVSEIG